MPTTTREETYAEMMHRQAGEARTLYERCMDHFLGRGELTGDELTQIRLKLLRLSGILTTQADEHVRNMAEIDAMLSTFDGVNLITLPESPCS